MFMDFLKSLSIFGDKAPTERVQELIEIIEGQADLDAQFDVSKQYLFYSLLYVHIYIFFLKSFLLYCLLNTWSLRCRFLMETILID